MPSGRGRTAGGPGDPAPGPGGAAPDAGGGMRGGGMPEGEMPRGGIPDGGMRGGGIPGGGVVTGKNMVLTFDNASITGVISASEAHHLKSVLYVNKEDYKLFGVVTNTAHASINNGVIVSLTRNSNWTVTGTSYLTRLSIEAGSTITAPQGYSVTMTVDGISRPIGTGDYKGQISLAIAKS
jgi:hypothetical protein